MIISAIANLSLNGKVLLAEELSHHAPKAGEAFFIQKAIEAANLIIGRKTYEVIKNLVGGEANIPHLFPDVTLVVLSSDKHVSERYPVIEDPEAALNYLQGFNEVIVGGGTATYHAFLTKNLVTDLYFSYVPVITGPGGLLGESDSLFIAFDFVDHRLLEEGVVQLHLKRR